MPTHITGQLAGLLWTLVSRCEMCRKAAFTSLMLIFFCVTILGRERPWHSCSKISSFNSIKSIWWSLRCKFVLVAWPAALLGGQRTWCTWKFSPLVLFHTPAEEKNACCRKPWPIQRSLIYLKDFQLWRYRKVREASVLDWLKYWLVLQPGTLVRSWQGSSLFLCTVHTLPYTAKDKPNHSLLPKRLKDTMIKYCF